MFRFSKQSRVLFTTKRFSSTLVILEQKPDKSLSASSLSALSFAQKLNFPITALLASSSSSPPSSLSLPISKLIIAKNPAYDSKLPEIYAKLVMEVVKTGGYSHVVAAHTAFGKNFMPRVAGMLDVSVLSDVVGVDGDVFVRPIYAGNAIAKVKSVDPIKFITIRPTAFPPISETSSSTPVVEDAPEVDTSSPTQFVSEELSKSDRPELGSAKIVVGGGRGLKSGENFGMLYELADKLGGTVGASRAAVDAGFVPNDLQIGQTGKIIAPQLYIAVGISGAIQHLAGMKDSKTIVAINKDPDAPIFQVADYGLVADLFEAVPELTKKI